MMLRRSLASVAALACIAAPISFGYVEAQPQELEVQIGQRGKDVVWAPSDQAVVDKMLDLANAMPSDYVIDLGSGDGRVVIAAAKRGARALGVEFDKALVDASVRKAIKEGVGDRAKFMRADLFETDLSQATVVTLFLGPDINMRLRRKLLALTPGTRIVSNSFHMGDWTPDNKVEVGGSCQSYCIAYYWIVPAKAAGKWRLPEGELALEQNYQTISGTLRAGHILTPLKGKLHGNEILLKIGGARFTGSVRGNVIEGTTGPGHAKRSWRATRV